MDFRDGLPHSRGVQRATPPGRDLDPWYCARRTRHTRHASGSGSSPRPSVSLPGRTRATVERENKWRRPPPARGVLIPSLDGAIRKALSIASKTIACSGPDLRSSQSARFIHYTSSTFSVGVWLSLTTSFPLSEQDQRHPYPRLRARSCGHTAPPPFLACPISVGPKHTPWCADSPSARFLISDSREEKKPWRRTSTRFRPPPRRTSRST